MMKPSFIEWMAPNLVALALGVLLMVAVWYALERKSRAATHTKYVLARLAPITTAAFGLFLITEGSYTFYYQSDVGSLIRVAIGVAFMAVTVVVMIATSKVAKPTDADEPPVDRQQLTEMLK